MFTSYVEISDKRYLLAWRLVITQALEAGQSMVKFLHRSDLISEVKVEFDYGDNYESFCLLLPKNYYVTKEGMKRLEAYSGDVLDKEVTRHLNLWSAKPIPKSKQINP